MKKYKCYMAGPAVFAPDHKEWAEAVVYECSNTIIEPLIPADGDVGEVHHTGPYHKTIDQLIYQKNIEMMKEADICIADISPFRGVSGDAGTLFEVGYMTALGKPVFLYSDLGEHTYRDRVAAFSMAVMSDYLLDDWHVEDFGLTENLMITQTGTVVYDCVEDAIEAANKLLNRH